MIKLLLLILSLILVGCTNPNVTNSVYYPKTLSISGGYSVANTDSGKQYPIQLRSGGEQITVGLTWDLKRYKGSKFVEAEDSN